MTDLPQYPLQETLKRLRAEFPHESELWIRQSAAEGIIHMIRESCNGNYDDTLGVMELMASENPELQALFNEYGSDA
jgi:hypothetical protein